MADESNERKEPSTKRWPLFVAISVVLVLWAFTFYSFVWGLPFGWIDVGDRGTFGDMFGGLNALFSGLAFAGIIYTIYMQRKELELQRKELALTRATLNAQREEMLEQNTTIRAQRFENTFFSMLRTFNNIIDAIDLHRTTAFPSATKVKTPVTLVNKGRDCFKTFQRTLSDELADVSTWPEVGAEFNSEDFDRHYDNWWKNKRTNLAHYFRTLYNIVKFIHESDVPNKHVYTDIVRAQLSDQEQAVLFYNCLSIHGRERFKALVERYALLKHVPDDLLLHLRHRELYKRSAFEDDI